MVLNESYNLCQKTTENLGSFQLRDKFGVSISPSSEEQSLAIFDATYPMCQQHGTLYLNPELGDCFSILQNGTLFTPLFPVGEQYSDQYCVEHALSADGHQV